MLSQLAILFGGRIAEDIFVGRISTGASNDFERATQIARDMVTRYGMSERMGVMVYAENEGEVFLGRSVTRSQNISEKTQQDVDAEVRRILDEQYAVAYQILSENRDKMETMCKALVEWETIDRDQVLEIMAGKQPSPPKDYSHNVRSNGDVIDGVEFETLPEIDEPQDAGDKVSVAKPQPETAETADEAAQAVEPAEQAAHPSENSQEPQDKA